VNIRLENQFERLELIFGKEAIEQLQKKRVAVFGVGGVGGFTVEALARSGIGTLDIIDNDKIVLSNLNRQIIATHSTLGRDKVDVLEERIHDINPKAKVNKYKLFYLPDTAQMFDFNEYDYIVDAVDTITAKIDLAYNAYKSNTPIISSMGAGNKIDPTLFKVDDIFNTTIDPIARVMRYKLRKLGVDRLKVVYSTETPKRISDDGDKRTPGSTAFVPSVVGLIIAGEVIKDLIKGA
jgi:tRNA A37 threonylcarbamoyladenosine dehydratase